MNKLDDLKQNYSNSKLQANWKSPEATRAPTLILTEPLGAEAAAEDAMPPAFPPTKVDMVVMTKPPTASKDTALPAVVETTIWCFRDGEQNRNMRVGRSCIQTCLKLG